MAAKKRPSHKDYVNSFRKEYGGGYTYTGESFMYEGGTEELRKERTRMWILAAVICVAVIVSGAIPAPMTRNTFYVIIPYVAEVWCAGLSVWALIRMTTGEYPLHGYVYHRAVPVLPGRCIALAAAAAAAAAGSVIFLIINGASEKAGFTVLFFVCKGIIIATAVVWRGRAAAMRWIMT